MQCFPVETDLVFIVSEDGEAGVFPVRQFWCRKFLTEQGKLSSTDIVEAFSGIFVIIFFLRDFLTDMDEALEMTSVMSITWILWHSSEL